MKSSFLFESERLGFRNWTLDDLSVFSSLNANKEVMRYFPKLLTKEESLTFLKRLIAHYEKHGFTYFAVEEKSTKEIIGFIGCAQQNYESPFTPAVDIGWRLFPRFWHKGYATEGAKACIDWFFSNFKERSLIAVCSTINIPSEKVMQRIPMQFLGNFTYPSFQKDSPLAACVCYQVSSPQNIQQ